MLRQFSIAVMFLTGTLAAARSRADEPKTADSQTAAPVATAEFTPAETAYIALAEEFREQLEKFWEQGSKLTDPKEIEEHYSKNDPAIEYLPKLLEFEREHAGEDVGLDALSEVASYAARGGDVDSPGFEHRREALARMPAYEDREPATLFIARVIYGRHDPQVVDYLRRLADSPQADPTVRAYAQLKLAEKLLALHTTRRAMDEKLQNVSDGMPTRDPNEIEWYREYLATLPPADELASGAEEAMRLLEELAASGESFRQPAYRAADPTGHLVRIDTEKSHSGTPLSVKATALLFKERHLRVGKVAPELELELISGQPWKLADQRGRVAVIQFSFTGCGPCEAMYPDLREMHQEFGDRLALVTILRDPTSESGRAAIDSGKFTWPIACDGTPGDHCTQWAVDSFPETYVVDRDGRIAAVGPRGEQLRWIVERLASAETSKGKPAQ